MSDEPVTDEPVSDERVTVNAIVRALDNGQELDTLAEDALDAIFAEHVDVAREMLKPIIHNAVRMIRRDRVRDLERGASTAADPLEERKELLAERFFAPGYGYVSWGEATEEQHLARSEYLRRQADALIGTADKHDQAIRDIRAAGVKCLAEIGRKTKRRAA